jgi:hypothetical protein
MGTPTGDMLRAASACAGMAVEASAEAAGLRKRVADLEAAGAVLLDAVRGDGAVTVEQINEAAAVLRKGK